MKLIGSILIGILAYWLNNHAMANNRVMPVGFGSEITGGLNGSVYQVTSLDDGGRGSLRSILHQAGNSAYIKIIPCGTMRLSRRLIIKAKNLTIDGSECVGGAGVQIIDYPVTLEQSDNIVITNLAFRLGDQAIKTMSSAESSDALEIGCSKNILIDHASIYWGLDENLSIYCYPKNSYDVSTNIVVQNSIIAEALDAPKVMKKKLHSSKGVLLGGRVENVAFYRNLFVSNSDRNIEVGSSPENKSSGKTRVRYINNMLYQTIYGIRTGIETSVEWQTEIDIIGNYQKASQTKYSSLTAEKPLYIHRENNNQMVLAYMKDNLSVSRRADNEPEENIFSFYRFSTGRLSILAAEATQKFKLSGKPLTHVDNIKIIAAKNLEPILLKDVGKIKPCRDPIDRRVIRNVADDVSSDNGGQKPVNSQLDVGGFSQENWGC